MGRFLRNLFLLVLVIAIFAAVALSISDSNKRRATELYNLQVTIQIETAVANALFEATRTAEAPLPQYRLIVLGEDDTLADIAARYHTTVEVLRMANALAPDVESGPGSQIIVPEGVQVLDPPRRLTPIEAQPGETLDILAQRLNVPIDVLRVDNPVLAQRPLNPGDIVFIPTIL